MYPRSRRDTFKALFVSAVEASSIISSALRPTRATPLRMPIVAGTPPLTLTTDSSKEANATLSGYGKPVDVNYHSRPIPIHEAHTMGVNGRL